MPSGGGAPKPMMPFSLWKATEMPFGDISRNERRQPDAQIDERVVAQFERDAPGDDFFRVHQRGLSTRWSMITPGVRTASGGMTPTGTIWWGSAMVTAAAKAMIGLKLAAVRR